MAIIRNPTPEELADFTPIELPSGKYKSPHQDFIDKLVKEQQKAIRAKLPFCEHKARDDYNEAIEAQEKSQLKQYGYVAGPIKVPELDWASYSDLKNFKVVDEGDTLEPATKSGKPARMVKYKTYQFKGYANKYIVQED